jgi:hypothetical protein
MPALLRVYLKIFGDDMITVNMKKSVYLFLHTKYGRSSV